MEKILPRDCSLIGIFSTELILCELFSEEWLDEKQVEKEELKAIKNGDKIFFLNSKNGQLSFSNKRQENTIGILIVYHNEWRKVFPNKPFTKTLINAFVEEIFPRLIKIRDLYMKLEEIKDLL